LGEQPSPLRVSVGQLTEAVGELDAAQKNLEALRHARIAGFRSRQRRHLGRVLVEDGRAAESEMRLDPLRHYTAEDITPGVVLGDRHARFASTSAKLPAIGPDVLHQLDEQVCAILYCKRLCDSDELGPGEASGSLL